MAGGGVRVWRRQRRASQRQTWPAWSLQCLVWCDSDAAKQCQPCAAAAPLVTRTSNQIVDREAKHLSDFDALAPSDSRFGLVVELSAKERKVLSRRRRRENQAANETQL